MFLKPHSQTWSKESHCLATPHPEHSAWDIKGRCGVIIEFHLGLPGLAEAPAQLCWEHGRLGQGKVVLPWGAPSRPRTGRPGGGETIDGGLRGPGTTQSLNRGGSQTHPPAEASSRLVPKALSMVITFPQPPLINWEVRIKRALSS